MHDGFWLLYSEQRLAETISGAAPRPEFEVSYADRKRVMNYLRRVVRRNRAERSVAKSARSFELDANMYDVQERDGKQYLAIMTLVPRKRLVIPLTGRTHMRGNIKVVLDFEQQRVEVHASYLLNVKEVAGSEPVVGLDAGVSEVYTDDGGIHYEPEFGKTLSRWSKQIKKTGRRTEPAVPRAGEIEPEEGWADPEVQPGEKEVSQAPREGGSAGAPAHQPGYPHHGGSASPGGGGDGEPGYPRESQIKGNVAPGVLLDARRVERTHGISGVGGRFPSQAD